MFIGIGINMVGQMTATSLQALLFYANEPGFTFEPWDITTLYQDRAGTTPVTAAGQSVGLRLSKDQGLRIGPEVNPDPGFDNPAAWTFGGATPGWAVTGGKAECTAIAGANRWVLIPNLLTVGATYLITADVVVTSGGCAPDVSTVVAPDATTSGTKRWIVTASTSTLQFIGRSNFIGSIDNVSFKTLAGNHEVAVSDAKRGVYGWMPKTGRRNKFLWTEDFSNPVWGKSSLTVSQVSGPDWKLVPSTSNALHLVSQGVAHDANMTCAVEMKADGYNFALIEMRTTGDGFGYAAINLLTGAVSAISGGVTATSEALSDGWWRFKVAWTYASGGLSRNVGIFVSTSMVTAGATFTGDGVSGIRIRYPNCDPTGGTYQRVASQYDITEAGVPTCYYVQADGVDDAYVTPTITPNTDKVQVFAGVRKLSDAAGAGIFLENSAGIGTNNGVFGLTAPLNSTGMTFGFGSKGTLFSGWATSGASFTAPVYAVITGIGDIASDTQILRANGIQVATTTTDQGTGNYLSYPAYIYSRGGTSLPFNGLDFGHAVRFGPNLDAATIARVEALIARNTPEVTL